MMFPGSSTTQTTESMREGSVQIAQTGRSVKALQSSHKAMLAERASIAEARRLLSSARALSRKKATRWADFGPRPGSRRSSSMRRAMGSG